MTQLSFYLNSQIFKHSKTENGVLVRPCVEDSLSRGTYLFKA